MENHLFVKSELHTKHLTEIGKVILKLADIHF